MHSNTDLWISLLVFNTKRKMLYDFAFSLVFLCRIFSLLTDYMIYILNCFNLYYSPSERQVLIMLLLYEYYTYCERLETDLSCCLLQVLLSFEAFIFTLLCTSSNQWRVFWSLQASPSPFVGYRVPYSRNGHSWEV